MCSVHPRSRGEHGEDAGGGRGFNGSSPLARGTLVARLFGPVNTRFIPARAGNTLFAAASASCHPVHPRSRGEHRAGRRSLAPATGSSPLARGTPIGASAPWEWIRFIPARAGNTISPRIECNSLTVHPRSRGEHAVGLGSGCVVCGSSPLARGTRQRASRPSRPRRFIPARAGNTPREQAARPASTVHPRSRGEHTGTGRCTLPKNGSSPLARGTLCAY